MHTVTFAEGPAGTTVVVHEVRADSAADRARLLRAGMREGMSEGLDRFDRLLDRLGPQR